MPDRFSFVDFPDFGRQFFYVLSQLRSGEDLVSASYAPASSKTALRSELQAFS